MFNPKLKLIGATTFICAFASGTAFAGDGKNCASKKKTEMKTEASMKSSAPTAVLSATEGQTKMKSVKKTYSFDEALELCQNKGASDLQACVDYKTGKV